MTVGGWLAARWWTRLALQRSTDEMLHWRYLHRANATTTLRADYMYMAGGAGD
jgi:hypothetical protein